MLVNTNANNAAVKRANRIDPKPQPAPSPANLGRPALPRSAGGRARSTTVSRVPSCTDVIVEVEGGEDQHAHRADRPCGPVMPGALCGGLRCHERIAEPDRWTRTTSGLGASVGWPPSGDSYEKIYRPTSDPGSTRLALPRRTPGPDPTNRGLRELADKDGRGPAPVSGLKPPAVFERGGAPQRLAPSTSPLLRSRSAVVNRRWAARSSYRVRLSVNRVVGGRHWTRTSDLLHVKRCRLSAVLGAWQ